VWAGIPAQTEFQETLQRFVAAVDEYRHLKTTATSGLVEAHQLERQAVFDLTRRIEAQAHQAITG
jgi:hypothetical protein